MASKDRNIVSLPQSPDPSGPSSPSKRESRLPLGTILKERRKNARITQAGLAAMLHVTRNTVINWENDKCKPDYDLVPEICSLLGIRLHELFHMEAENGLDPLEDQIVTNLRLLEPGSRRVVSKMISAMVEEELAQKEEELARKEEELARKEEELARKDTVMQESDPTNDQYRTWDDGVVSSL